MEPETNSFPSHGQRTLAAIVFTDVVNFSGRMSRDEDHTLELVQRDLSFMSRLCEEFAGKVLKWTGDGLLLYFTSAVQAVACALKIQQAIAAAAHELPPEDVLQHRIGIHLGDVFVSATDVMGDGVNIAARLQAEAVPGGICISQVVYDVVKKRIALKASYLGPRELKHIQEPIPLYQIILDAQPETLKPTTELSVTAPVIVPDTATVPESATVAPPLAAPPRSEVTSALDQGDPSASGLQPQPAPCSPSSSGLLLSVELKGQLEQLLFAAIGPIARLMLRQAVEKSTTLAELAANLILSLPELARNQFQQQVSQLIEALPEANPASRPAPEIILPPPMPIPSLPISDRLEPEFLHQCEQALSKHIGPIAPLLIQRTLSQQPQLTRSQLVEILIAHLPTPEAQAELRQMSKD
jgi:class 3 adenylate cyclase